MRSRQFGGRLLDVRTPGFGEEAEWRIIMTPNVERNENGSEIHYGSKTVSPLHFRANANSEIVSYFKLPFDVELVTEIWLGPKNYARDYRRGFTRLHVGGKWFSVQDDQD